tara:strand:- start:2747 stop:3382 length:636 start_codon:yes stop_codon:yes gene_type:complete
MSAGSITSTDVRRAAMDLLARREHGASELQDKLLRRFSKTLRANKSRQNDEFPTSPNAFDSESAIDFAPGLELDETFSETPSNAPSTAPSEVQMTSEVLRTLIQVEVSKLTDSGLQSDARLAESFIRARANRGQGPMKVKMELRQKGLDDILVEQAMDESGVDWQSLAIDVSAKKFSRGFDPADPKQRAKRQRFLQQRGFSFEHISAVERQ